MCCDRQPPPEDRPPLHFRSPLKVTAFQRAEPLILSTLCHNPTMTTTPVVTSADYTISASAPIADIIAIIKRHGAVVLQGLVTAEDAKQMKADIQPYLDELAPKDEVKVW